MTARVHYFDGQLLGVAEFAGEQAHHVAAQRRHVVGHHRWGVVAGLELQADGEQLRISPGYAVDGFGRDLVLEAPRLLVPGLPKTPGLAEASAVAAAFDVWIGWSRRPAIQPPPDRPDAFGRWDETPDVFLTVAGAPDAATTVAGDFPAWRDAPDDPAVTWPVRLGSVYIDPAGRLATAAHGRRAAGVTAAEIAPHDGSARLALGAAVPGDDAVLRVYCGASEAPALRLGAGGDLDIAGSLRLRGGVLADGGAVAFVAPDPAAAPIAASPSPSAPGVARLYQVIGSDGVAELRLELPAGGRFVVNAAPASSSAPPSSAETTAHAPALSVSADGAVMIGGDLVVSGRIQPTSVVPAGLSAEARQLVKSLQMSRLTQEALAHGPIPPDPDPDRDHSPPGHPPAPPLGPLPGLALLIGRLFGRARLPVPAPVPVAVATGTAAAATTAVATRLFPEAAATLQPVADAIAWLAALASGAGG